jgi:hypothetical protein
MQIRLNTLNQAASFLILSFDDPGYTLTRHEDTGLRGDQLDTCQLSLHVRLSRPRSVVAPTQAGDKRDLETCRGSHTNILCMKCAHWTYPTCRHNRLLQRVGNNCGESSGSLGDEHEDGCPLGSCATSSLTLMFTACSHIYCLLWLSELLLLVLLYGQGLLTCSGSE